MATIPPLHAVPDSDGDAAKPEPSGLLEAIASGDVLEMLLAQRRLIAQSLVTANENTRPQFNNELNKLHALIAAEQKARREADVAAAEQEAAKRDNPGADEALDPATL